MSVSIKWQGLEELKATISNAHPKAVEQSVQVLKNNAEYGKSIAQVTAPKDTGFLRGEIKTSYQGMTAKIISGAGYSGYLEYGTRKMSARPYMRPMLEQVTPKFQAEMTKAMKGAFK